MKNTPAKFHPYPIWNDGALGFFEQRRPKKNNINKQNINGSVDIRDQFLIQKIIALIIA